MRLCCSSSPALTCSTLCRSDYFAFLDECVLPRLRSGSLLYDKSGVLLRCSQRTIPHPLNLDSFDDVKAVIATRAVTGFPISASLVYCHGIPVLTLLLQSVCRRCQRTARSHSAHVAPCGASPRGAPMQRSCC